MQRKTKFVIAGAGLLALASAGFAGLAMADRQGMMMEGFMGGPMGMGGMGMMRHAEAFAERYDANKDGKISQEEINASRAQWLADADASKDGKLSMEEFQGLWLKAHRERMVRAFQHLDRNGDGVVTAEEYADPLKDVVAGFDQNKDGVLSREDLEAFRDQMRQQMGRRGEGKGFHMQGRQHMWMGDDGDGEGSGDNQ